MITPSRWFAGGKGSVTPSEISSSSAAGTWHRETRSHSTFAPFTVHRPTRRPSLDVCFHPGGSVPMRASCGVVHRDRRHFLI